MDERITVKRVCNRFTSNFTALSLVIPGVGLYVYIIYIIASKLVYPATFLPFVQSHHLKDEESIDKMGLWSTVFRDSLLLCAFGLQHSCMASHRLKGFFSDVGLPVLARPVYICCTCFVINVIHHLWEPASSLALWHVESSEVTVMLLLALHLLCWVLIASSVFTIDYLELMGIKQIYYSYYGFGSPMTYKSSEQQQLLYHNRHPIFLAPTIILWAVPVMTYDRLLIAVMLPLYLGLGTVIGMEDVLYVSEQFRTKRDTLLANGVKKTN